jgi:hypothetical protein
MATPEQQPIIDVARRTLATRKQAELLRRIVLSQSMMSSILEISAAEGFKRQALGEAVSRAGLQSVLQEIASSETADGKIDFQKIADDLAGQVPATGENVMAAVVVVLSHSVADDVFTGACESAIELDPVNWIPELNMERKIPLGLLRDKGPAGVFAAELEKLRQQLSAKALPSRAELFFRHVKIRHSPSFGPADPQCFRQSKLVEAEALQNAIVHGSDLSLVGLEQSRQTMLFLHQAALTALRSLASAYRLPVEWNTLLSATTKDAR